jgi:predicted membrane-bound spermidine synthase
VLEENQSSDPSGGRAFRPLILSVTFVAGWTVMTLEMLGARQLAPHFGYSIYQWGALIGVVLACMAGGYWIGAWLGDRGNALKLLWWCLVGAFLWTSFTPALSHIVGTDASLIGPVWGAVAASLILVGPPVVLLAVVSPITAKLAARGGIAYTTGTVYMISTIGSIGGTFFTSFYSIPEIGTNFSYSISAAVQLLAIVGVSWMALRLSLIPILALVGAFCFWWIAKHDDGTVYGTESVHNIIKVVDKDDARLLYLNMMTFPQTRWPKSGILTHEYYDNFLLGPAINEGRRVLFLGVAGGTALRQMTAVWPGISVLGVELDPLVSDVARRYFGLDREPRIKLVTADARWFVDHNSETFDVAAVDLFYGGFIPFYCATTEFFGALSRRLSSRGVLIMNVPSPEPGDDLIGPMVRTVRTVFPSVFVIRRTNIVLIASKENLSEAELRSRLTKPGDDILKSVAIDALTDLRVIEDHNWPVLTDDQSDLEFRSFRMLAKFITGSPAFNLTP